MKNSWKRQAETELYVWESEIKSLIGVSAWEALLVILHSLEMGYRRRRAGSRMDFLKHICGYKTAREKENGAGAEDRPEQVDS